MNKIIHCGVFLFLVHLNFTSCISDIENHTINEGREAIALIDSIPIYYDEIDSKVRQELFDQLNRIYTIRRITLEEKISEELIKLEATKLNVSVDSLLNLLYKRKINENNINQYLEVNGFNGKIPELRKNLLFHDINSDVGQNVLIKRFKRYILSQYTDSLAEAHEISVLLKPPISPVIKIDDLLVHYRGNLKSNITLLEISDFDCDMCRENRHVLDQLFAKYQEEIRFGFTHFGSYVSISAIASECAANQGKFWEMHDTIFNSKQIPDTTDLFQFALDMQLDMNAFNENFHDSGLVDKIEYNLYKLESAGIYGTPTIMINNRLIFNSASLEDIENMLQSEISEEILK